VILFWLNSSLSQLLARVVQDRKRETPTSEDLRLLQLELKYREKAAATPFGSGSGSGEGGGDKGGSDGDQIDSKTNEPKAWKKKRKDAIKVRWWWCAFQGEHERVMIVVDADVLKCSCVGGL
jgi:hypothetical protein